MNRHPFKLVPFEANDSAIEIEATVYCKSEPELITLCLEFDLKSASGLQSLLIPASSTSPKRLNNLWQHTCFEAFLARPEQKEYLEFNFSPSGDWNAYHFDDIRAGMKEMQLPAPPLIALNQSNSELLLNVELKLPEEWFIPSTLIHLTAVIAGQDLSYWALAHKTEKPDFHNRSCFVEIMLT